MTTKADSEMLRGWHRHTMAEDVMELVTSYRAKGMPDEDIVAALADVAGEIKATMNWRVLV